MFSEMLIISSPLFPVIFMIIGLYLFYKHQAATPLQITRYKPEPSKEEYPPIRFWGEGDRISPLDKEILRSLGK